VRFAGIAHEHCPVCGERVFDLETAGLTNAVR
jgi:hypothetical protein